MSKRLITIELY